MNQDLFGAPVHEEPPARRTNRSEVDPEGRPLPRAGLAWSNFRSSSFHPCDTCMARAEKVNGRPVTPVEKATLVRRDRDSITYWCARHGHDARTGDQVSRPRS